MRTQLSSAPTQFPRCSFPVERMPLSTRLRKLVEGIICFLTSPDKAQQKYSTQNDRWQHHARLTSILPRRSRSETVAPPSRRLSSGRPRPLRLNPNNVQRFQRSQPPCFIIRSPHRSNATSLQAPPHRLLHAGLGHHGRCRLVGGHG